MPKLIWNGSLLLAILSGLLTNAAHALRVSERLSFRLPFLEHTMLYDLRDEVYYFPANESRRDQTVYLPLRRWDMIFTGDLRNTPDSPVDQENINHIIPGPFNHMAVYLGKDRYGLAYAVELNVVSSLVEGGAIRLICLGSDFGILRHPEWDYLQDRRKMSQRWAKRLVPQARTRLLEHEAALLARIQTDLVMGFPYQFEYAHSGSPFDPNIYLIDDGLEGGASCSDYWIGIFEVYAGLCLYGIRMSVEELENYFRDDPQGRLAYVPTEISPFGEPILMRNLLARGFRAIPAAPHVYPCNGSEDTGLVLPYLIMQNPQLENIPGQPAPTRLPWFHIKPW